MKMMNMGPWPVEYGLVTDEAEWTREMRRRGLFELFPTQTQTVKIPLVGGERLVISIVVPDERSNRERIAVVAHEAVHVWQSIFEHIGEEVIGWEVEACTVQWIVEWLLGELTADGWVKA